MRPFGHLWILTGALLLTGPASGWAADSDHASCTAPDLPLRPVVATHTMPPYPDVSVMTGEQGTTLMQIAIGPDGVPTNVTVIKSSGSPRLDEAAQEHVKNNWRWNAPIKNCEPVASDTKVSYAWSLKQANNVLSPPTFYMNARDYPPGALQRHEQGTVVMTVFITDNGQVIPHVAQSSGFPELDARSMEVVSHWHWMPAGLENHAVTTIVNLLSIWRIEAPK
jgi:TonB family protein